MSEGGVGGPCLLRAPPVCCWIYLLVFADTLLEVGAGESTGNLGGDDQRSSSCYCCGGSERAERSVTWTAVVARYGIDLGYTKLLDEQKEGSI